MKVPPETILRRHAIERYRQRSIPSRDMEATLTLAREEAEPRMSRAQWDDSCQNTKGCPNDKVTDEERLLFWLVLETYYCHWVTEAPHRHTQEAAPPPRFSTGAYDTGASEWVEAGQPGDAVVTSIAVGLTFQEAADEAGVPHARARRWWRDALDRVVENVAARKDGE